MTCRKGEIACCDEIKAFAVKHNIKQQQIAVLAGLIGFLLLKATAQMHVMM